MIRVLVVDDSLIMRKKLTSVLKTFGCQVVGEASNGQIGYEMYKKLQPDLVTMDITMPIMDGIEAVQKIREEFSDARIIMMTALHQQNLVLKAIKYGAEDYIVKPVSHEKIKRIIANFDTKNQGDVSNKRDDDFVVSNIDGGFVIKINDETEISRMTYDAIANVIDGLIYIKPLKITFELSKNMINKKEKFNQFQAKIKNAGGEIFFKEY